MRRVKQLHGRWCWFLLSATGLLISDAFAQRTPASALPARQVVSAENNAPVPPPASTQAALQAMFTSADVVFTGEVLAVQPAARWVDVRFRVDDAVRGVVPGDIYTLREWAALWVDGSRYTVGERRLMLLHAASDAGFSSPVGGSDGAIPLAGDDATGKVDLRWIAARVARAPVARPATAAAKPHVAAPPSDALAFPAGVIDSGVVLDLLHAWQKNSTVTP